MEHASHDTYEIFSFDDLVCPDLDIYSALSPFLYCYLIYPLESLLANLGFATVICPLSVAYKAKSDYFDL